MEYKLCSLIEVMRVAKLSVALVITKVKEAAEKLSYSDFKPPGSWFDRLKKERLVAKDHEEGSKADQNYPSFFANR